MIDASGAWDVSVRPTTETNNNNPNTQNNNAPPTTGTTGHRTSVSANNYRIDMDKLKRWADLASRQELTDMLFRQAVDFQRLGHNHTMLSIENASLSIRVHQLEAQLTSMHEKSMQDLAAIRFFETEGQEALDRFRTMSPLQADNSKSMTAKLADTLRMARDFTDGRNTGSFDSDTKFGQPAIRVEEVSDTDSSETNWRSSSCTKSNPTMSRLRNEDHFRARAPSTNGIPTDYEISQSLKDRTANALASHYTARHHRAARIIQNYYRHFKITQRWHAVKQGARRRSVQDDSFVQAQSPELDSSMLSLRIAEEVTFHQGEADHSPDSTPIGFNALSHAGAGAGAGAGLGVGGGAAANNTLTNRHHAHSAPNSPAPTRSSATSKASPIPSSSHQRKSLTVSTPSHQGTSNLIGSRPESFLSPATHMQHSAQALAAMLDDSEADESVTRTRTPSPEIMSWSADDSILTVETERIRRIGIYHFNRDPKKGVDWLMRHGMLRDEAREVAAFFHTEPGLNRRMIGEYLGNVISSFNMAVLEAYVDQFDLKSMTFDHALRFFIASFRLPGEAQKIERILQTFARKYHACNPGLFQHEDTPFVLAFSIVMLNTDSHNVANKRKMTKEDWIRNNRGIDNGKDLSRQYLEEIYDRISAEEFQTLPDNTTMIERISQDIVGLKENIVVPHRQFIRMCIAHELEDADKGSRGKHTRALYLFSDRLIVTKPRGNKFMFRQSLTLLDLSISVDKPSAVALAEKKDYILSVVNKHNICVFRCYIDPSTRGAARFEEELREMMATCAEIEGERFRSNASKESDIMSRRSITSCSESSNSASVEESHRNDSPGRKNTMRIWAIKKKATDAQA